MDEDLKRLVAARGQLKASITRMINYKGSLGDGPEAGTVDPIIIKQKRDRLAKIFTDYNESNLEIMMLDPADTENIQEIEDKVDELNGFFSSIIDNAMSNSSPRFSDSVPSSRDSAPSARNGVGFRLPRIQLHKFNGEVGGYQSFISLFISVIDTDKNLSSCEKLYYLKAHLEGEALTLINYLPLTAESYSIALDLLKQRYDNKRQLINHHISSIIESPPMQRTSAACIRNLVSSVKQHLGALTNLGAPTSHWDLVIIAILSKKIDQYTLRAYHLENQNNSELPQLNDFLTFLENRAAALEALGESSPVKRRSSLVSINNPKPVKTIKCLASRATAGITRRARPTKHPFRVHSCREAS
ncbi:uncharacterized protein isoform X1 [Choristoneura fumiferana]|uniref:uncharacterized protein isoform X1 n=1 Tax=Choristoneura fumiferana TaxID=7141 RepID=UPI003D15737A